MQEAKSELTADETLSLSNLLVSYKSANTGLWGIYIAATFTGAAFSLATTRIELCQMVAAAVGFSIFALGHFFLMKQNLKSQQIIRKTLSEASSNEDSYRTSLRSLGMNTYNPGPSLIAHIMIDFCVLLLIFSPMALKSINL